VGTGFVQVPGEENPSNSLTFDFGSFEQESTVEEEEEREFLINHPSSRNSSLLPGRRYRWLVPGGEVITNLISATLLIRIRSSGSATYVLRTGAERRMV